MNFDHLVTLCQRTHEELCHRAARVVDAHLVVRNWLFGHYITEFEQKGADRAQYGARLLGSLADRLKPLKIKGSSVTRLKLYRSFYRTFPIGPTLSDQSGALHPQTLEISPTVSGLLISGGGTQSPPRTNHPRTGRRRTAMKLVSPAPTVRPIPAQGIALGSRHAPIQALKGRPKTACRDIAPARDFSSPSSFIPQPSSLP